jgi:hypothetical protein
MSAPVVAVIGTNRQLDALTPLRAEYHRRGIGDVAVLTNTLLPPEAVSEVADDVDAVLMAYPRHRAPSTVVPWPAAATARGRRIPIGVVPTTGTRCSGSHAPRPRCPLVPTDRRAR